MFQSFFPQPKMFFSSLAIWCGLLILVWYSFGQTIGEAIGFDLSEKEQVIGLGHFITSEFLWFDTFFAFGTIAFFLVWRSRSPHEWQIWSVLGSALLIYLSYASVQVSVVINAWYGPFYNDIQTALTGDGGITAGDLYGHFLVFCTIAFPYILFIILNRFFTAHYIFRWRTAMNNYYVERWKQVRNIEGASQRIQEDTMRFAAIMEGLGVAFVDSIMTLIAFLPVLAALSVHVESLPILGAIPYPLVALKPGTLSDLFANVRRNYFRIYWHYTYFNLFRYMYIQADNVVAYIFLVPTIVSGRITLGIMNQILRAFGQVASSFQFLVSSWTTIIELISIYKRLQAFEAAISDQPLPKIDQEFIESGSQET